MSECKLAKQCLAYNNAEQYQGRVVSFNFTTICDYEGPDVTGCPMYDKAMADRTELLEQARENLRNMIATIDESEEGIDKILTRYDITTDNTSED